MISRRPHWLHLSTAAPCHGEQVRVSLRSSISRCKSPNLASYAWGHSISPNLIGRPTHIN